MRITDIEKYAKKNNIPIMESAGIKYLIKYIKENNTKKILEIGTAIGYSAIRMAMIDDDIKVTSIERDIDRYSVAVENINKFNLKDRINLINDDALNVELDGKFDLIFIDAAKSQSIKFFEKFERNLSDSGTIITDNINFHGLTFSKEVKGSRNLKQMVRKIKDYYDYVMAKDGYHTEYVNIGDGLTVSEKK